MSPSARTTARFAPATARPTSPACAPWRSTPYAWPVTRTSPPACDNTHERPFCRWPPSGSYDDFAGALGGRLVHRPDQFDRRAAGHPRRDPGGGEDQHAVCVDRGVLVGAPAAQAGGWAIGQAGLTGQAVEAVTSWSVPMSFGDGSGTLMSIDWEGDATSALKNAVANVVA